jgi:PHD/YefM family antitoxin component YafN of YafNO toxin-antitoxin module
VSSFGTILIRMKQTLKIQYITDENGKKQSVVMPVETYEEILEDIQDLVAIAERKDEPTVSFEELIKNLKADGLL